MKDRFICQYKLAPHLPTLIAIGGMHGNEASGIEAIKTFAHLYKDDPSVFQGNFFGLYGNKKALAKKVRFIEKDLNRLWDHKTLEATLTLSPSKRGPEEEEQASLWQALNEIFSYSKSQVYVVDLHSTSSKTEPYIIMDDNFFNFKLTNDLPFIVVSGLKYFIKTPLVTLLNKIGFPAITFEAGQHDDPTTKKNHLKFLHYVCENLQILNPTPKGTSYTPAANYRIIYRLALKKEDSFTMLPGFTNFVPITKNQPLAYLNKQEIVAKDTGFLFMPLYQPQGEDGFFIIKREVAP